MRRVSSILLAVIIAVSSMFAGNIGGTNTLGKVNASASIYKVVNGSKRCTVNKVTYYFEQSSNKVKKRTTMVNVPHIIFAQKKVIQLQFW